MYIGAEEYRIIVENLKKAREEGKTPAFSYDRVSTLEQVDGMSLQYQSTGAAAYSGDRDLFVVYYFTVAESASKEGRRVFNTMIDLGLRLEVKHLIFKSTDRMSRNYNDLARIMDLIEKNGFTIHLYQSNKVINANSTHDEKFIIGIEQAVAKHLSDKISHDIRAVNSYKAKKGISPGSGPFGYKYDRVNKRFIIDRDNEYILRFLFDEFDGGTYSLSDFSAILNSKGFLTKSGYPWTKSSLFNILENPFYHGEFRRKNMVLKGTQETYYEKARYLERLKRLSTACNTKLRKKKETLLHGLVKCRCGRFLTPDLKKDRYLYYVHKCQILKGKQRSYLEDTLFAAINKAVAGLELEDSMASSLKNLFSERFTSVGKDNGREILSLRRKISNLEVNKNKLYDLYLEDDYFTRDDLKRKLAQLDKSIMTLNAHLKSLSVDYQRVDIEVQHVIATFMELPGLYMKSEPAKKVAILKELADFVVVGEEGMEFQWKKPYSFFMKSGILGSKKKDDSDSSKPSSPAPPVGLEPTTQWLTATCSTD